MEGGPPYWPDDGSNGELMEPDKNEEDPAVEKDLEELGATVEKYGEFVPKLLDRLERELATDALSLWEGFAAFCEESVGVPPESVVAVVLEPVANRIEDLKSRALGAGGEGRDHRGDKGGSSGELASGGGAWRLGILDRGTAQRGAEAPSLGPQALQTGHLAHAPPEI